MPRFACSRLLVLFLASGALACGGARAEEWQDTHHVTLIDVDSIHRDADGLVYFLEKDKYPFDAETPNDPRRAAVDCVNRVSYSAYSIAYESDWRSKGQSVKAGTMGAELLDFVCSRVK